MKISTAPLVLLLLCFACGNKTEKKQTVILKDEEVDPSLVTDSSWGAIRRGSDFNELKIIFGESNVKDERICGAECVDSVDVTIVHPGKNEELIIYWADSAGYHQRIGFINSGQPSAPYHTKGGIRMGSSLRDLLTFNGSPITFSGFGWDYGGEIQSYNKGALENSKVFFRLDIPSGGVNELYGDTELDTGMPAVKKALDSIKVVEMRLSFY
jgi:hypothetical protein